ncbi:ATP-binding cassette, subfamily G (WHITE), member 2 [Fistulifera solaris]|uniref:ATP-binding cassette, subfamily G (WHITE), member 2 n=1 Tax=Fistulifera solaris TaxID=1519565 RepID=A0A1Z5JVD6_FISSO|nr:ATP-binding cassette, subfamily G (WHITE), member 2 [Fistulifera solaris]|eukprot:GAX18004.1 ATP-binding cassette, subfamily G (WHITE), member 2 [Fistulifera solaris]
MSGPENEDNKIQKASREDVEATTRPHVYTPECPDNAPAVLTFSNLTVTKRGGNKKKLLNNVSGSMTGGLWAIMGPSGSGKTTLLSTLALRLNTRVMEVKGEIRLNGREYDASLLKSMSAYVMQDDLLHAELTVAETLYWASLLRMPLDTKEKDRAERVQEVIELMGIEHSRDTIVGNTRRKGISGGERKRLCIAVELLNRPKLIFLDEPTSGLDSTTAYIVIKAIKNLTSLGECTAVCTIHQPAQMTFALFDNLILMKSGEAVFQGSLGNISHFLDTLGKPCPPNTCVADHLIEAIAPHSLDHEYHRKFTVPIDLGYGYEKHNFADMQEAKSILFQISVLVRRNLQQQMRNWDTWLMGVLSTIVIAFFISGGVWKGIGNDQEAIALLPPALFFTCVNQGIFASLQCVNSFPGERAIMLRERQSGAYTTLAYFTAKSLVDTVVLIWQPILFSCIVYPMFNLQDDIQKFFIYMLFMVLCSMAAVALATAVTCIALTVELSTVILSLFFEICRLYGGFFTSPNQLDTAEFTKWKWLDAISYIKYAFVGVALNELNDLEFTCPSGDCEITTGEQVSAQKGYDEYSIPLCAGILVLYIAVCRFIGYMGLKFIKH